jgi:hypothetical protein
MTIRAYYRNELALSQLEAALSLYFGGNNYAAVITLAGAADEVFGKLLSSAGKESSIESLKRAVGEIHERLYGESTPPKQIAERANRAKNSLKHWDEGDPILVKFDLGQEAKDMLYRAIDNYWILEQKLTPAMEKFQREEVGTPT